MNEPLTESELEYRRIAELYDRSMDLVNEDQVQIVGTEVNCVGSLKVLLKQGYCVIQVGDGFVVCTPGNALAAIAKENILREAPKSLEVAVEKAARLTDCRLRSLI